MSGGVPGTPRWTYWLAVLACAVLLLGVRLVADRGAQVLAILAVMAAGYAGVYKGMEP